MIQIGYVITPPNVVLRTLGVNQEKQLTSHDDGAQAGGPPVCIVLPRISKNHVRVEAAVLDADTLNENDGSARFRTAFDSPVLICDGVYFQLTTEEATRPVQQVQNLHYKTLQRFCESGRPDPPFDRLKLNVREWANCFEKGVCCRDRMVNIIVRSHVVNGGSCDLAPPTYDFSRNRAATRAVQQILSEHNAPPFNLQCVEHCNEKSGHLCLVELVSLPKRGVTVVPVALTVDDQCVFTFNEVLEPEAGRHCKSHASVLFASPADSWYRAAGYFAHGLFSLPDGEAAELRFRFHYCKLDIETMTGQLAFHEFKVEQNVLCADQIELKASESSILRVRRLQNEKPPPWFGNHIRNTERQQSLWSAGLCVDPCDDAAETTHDFMVRICKLTTLELQNKCFAPSGRDLRIGIDAMQWRRCWNCGFNCRFLMIREIAKSLKPPMSGHPIIAYIKGSPESRLVLERIHDILNAHWASLQTYCRKDAVVAGVPWLAVFGLSPLERKLCYRSGARCRDEMAYAILKSVDDRVFVNIKYENNRVTGYLKKE